MQSNINDCFDYFFSFLYSQYRESFLEEILKIITQKNIEKQFKIV